MNIFIWLAFLVRCVEDVSFFPCPRGKVVEEGDADRTALPRTLQNLLRVHPHFLLSNFGKEFINVLLRVLLNSGLSYGGVCGVCCPLDLLVPDDTGWGARVHRSLSSQTANCTTNISYIHRYNTLN